MPKRNAASGEQFVGRSFSLNEHELLTVLDAVFHPGSSFTIRGKFTSTHVVAFATATSET